jgi:hypothetical protein
MLELNQILRANEINFALLSAVPALLGAFMIGWLLKRPFIKVILQITKYCLIGKTTAISRSCKDR